MTETDHKPSGTWRDPPAAYGRLSRLLHWLFAALLLIGAPLGITGANLSVGPMQVVARSTRTRWKFSWFEEGLLFRFTFSFALPFLPAFLSFVAWIFGLMMVKVLIGFCDIQ